MEAQTVIPLLTAKIVGSYLRHHTVGASELPDLVTSVHRLWVKLDDQVLQKSCLPQPFRCGNLFATIT